MKKSVGVLVLIVLLLLSSGAAGWLWFERSTLVSRDGTVTAEYATLKDQITKADGVQDTNRQLQDQVDALETQLEAARSADPGATTPLPTVEPTPVDPNAPTPEPGSTPTPGGVEPPADVLALMTTIEQEVIEIRGLPETRPVVRRFMTRDELRSYIVSEMEKDESPDDYRRSTAELWLQGLADKDLDLRQLLIDLQTEQIAGFYDPEVDTFYLIGDAPALPPLDQTTYAHEFDHNLQDQLIDLNAGLESFEFDADGSLAYRSLVEGDATLLMQQWLQEKLLARMTPAELQQLLQSINETDTTMLDSVPKALSAGLTFPYEQGLAFVQQLYDTGGWAAVSAALKDPPTTTEQIIHPEKYLQREQPQFPARIDLAAALGDGWTTAYTSTQGEFDFQIWLQETGATGDIKAAAAGIGGALTTLYEQNEGASYMYQIATRWDTPADGNEFLAALRSTMQPEGDLFRRKDVLAAIKGDGQEWTILLSDNEAALRAGLAALP